MAMPPCPFCSQPSELHFRSKDFNRKLSRQTFDYFRCPECRVIFISPVPTDLGRYYPESCYTLPTSQAEPKPEIKLIRCAAGAICDVLVDVRPASPAFGRWEAFELTATNRRMLYVSGGLAHGFRCLQDNCEVFYQMSELYYPALARGIRWNDPTTGIRWPLQDPELSEKDRGLPLLAELFPGRP
jgi:hypothetical protein